MPRIALLVALVVACGGGPRPAPAPAPAEPPATGFVTTDDGVRLWYRKLGDGAPVAIVPGATFFTAAAQERLARRHTIVFYDLRNRGRSDPFTGATIDHDLRDLEAVRAHVGADRFAPVGWSYLGLLVILYADAHPDRVTRVVQLGPASRVPGAEFPPELTEPPDPATAIDLEAVRASGAEGRDLCEREWAVQLRLLLADPARAADAPRPCAHPNEWPSNLGPHFRSIFTSIHARPPLTPERLAALRVPVLTIHGRRDRNSAYGAGVDWAASLPDARLLTVDDAAHMVWVDEPAVLDAIDEFLGGAWPAAARQPPPREAGPRNQPSQSPATDSSRSVSSR